jgi:hypothetical protein
VSERQQLEERLQGLEQEVESWEQRNEDSRLQEGELVEKLRSEIADLRAENSAQRQKLDSMFLELEESKRLCQTLEKEREENKGRGEEGGGVEAGSPTGEAEGGSPELSSRLKSAELERDRMDEERDRATEERDRVREELNAVIDERDGALEARDRAEEDRDRAVKERDRAQDERDSLIEERNLAVIEKATAEEARVALMEERDRLIQDRDVIAQERDAAVCEKESVLTERDSAVQARDWAVKGRDTVEEQMGLLILEKEDVQQELAKTLQERDDLIAARDQATYRVSQLEAQLAAETAEKPQFFIGSKRDHAEDEDCSTELRGRVEELEQQVELLSTEKTTLELEIKQMQQLGSVEGSPLVQRTAAVSLSQQTPGQSGAKAEPSLTVLQAQNHQLVELVREKEAEVQQLQQRLQGLEEEQVSHQQHTDSAAGQVTSLEAVLAEKDNEIERLYQDVRQLTAECDRTTRKLSDADDKIESLKTQLQETEGAFTQLQVEMESEQERTKVLSERSVEVSELRVDLDSARDRVRLLETEVTEKEEIVANQKAGIADLNARLEEQSRKLEKSQMMTTERETVVACLRQSSLDLSEEVSVLKAQLEEACRMLTSDQRQRVMDAAAPPPLSPVPLPDGHPHLPALEYKPNPPLELKAVGADSKNGSSPDRNLQNGELAGLGDGDSDKLVSDSRASEKQAALSHQEYATLLQRLEEKEEAIAELKQSNASLLKMAEGKSAATVTGRPQSVEAGNILQLEVHKLQSEVSAEFFPLIL